MAIRTLAPKIQSSLRRSFLRPVDISSIAAGGSNRRHRRSVPLLSSFSSETVPGTSIPTLDLGKFQSFPLLSSYQSSPILDLGDEEKLFGNFRAAKLLKSSATLEMAAIDPLVDVGMWVMNSRLIKVPILKDAILGTVKHTFYEQFCAGVDREEMGRTVKRLWKSGIRSMLVYGVEDVDNNDACDRNFLGFLNTIESAKSLPSSSASFVIVKISAICPKQILQRVSNLLRWEHKDPSLHLPWKLNTLPIFSDSSPMYHTPTQPAPLTPEEEDDLRLAHLRFTKLCQKCLLDGVPLTVDAEYTSVQPAIDYFTYSAAVMCNREKNPIVFATIQAYLKDAKERLLLTAEAAEKMGVPLGIKLVRGAYMSTEARVADELGCESPIHESIQDTHDCYNECAAFMLRKIANGRGDAVVLATHNVESGELAAARAREFGIGKENHRVQFAQLYGMSEALSLGLRNAGFVVSKYMPFGPIDEVLPYLLRRAEENRGMLSTSSLDRALMMKELKRRMKRVFCSGNWSSSGMKLGEDSAFS